MATPDYFMTVKVFLNDGSSYSTSVNRACSDAEVRGYFVGAEFAASDEVTMRRCTNIEISR